MASNSALNVCGRVLFAMVFLSAGINKLVDYKNQADAGIVQFTGAKVGAALDQLAAVTKTESLAALVTPHAQQLVVVAAVMEVLGGFLVSFMAA